MKKSIPLLLSVIVALTFFSCTQLFDNGKDDKSKEEKVVDKMLSDSQMKILKDMGMPINSGDNPPDVTGIYNTNDFDCIKDTINQFPQNLNYYFKFYDLVGDDLKIDYTNKNGDRATANGGFIFGEKNKFSIYMETDGTNGSIIYKTVNIYSGTFSATGIQDFTMGFIMTSKTGDDDDYMMPVNAARIYKEADLLAATAADPGFSIYADNVRIGEAVMNLLTSAGR